MSINYAAVTKRINENFRERIDSENKLLNSDISALVANIEPVNPLVYYHRLIAELHPESEFAKCLKKNEDDIVNIGKTAMKQRNDIIKEAIKDNLGTNSVELFPGVEFEDVFDTLKRNDKGHGIAATGITREKCFLVALAFNLTYEQTEELLLHCLGERDFNYKNPYEVILVYCLKDHSAVYKRFCDLKNLYEKTEKSQSTLLLRTVKYKQEFLTIQNESELINFLCNLPNTNRESARLVFSKLFSELKIIYKDSALTDMWALASNSAFYGKNCKYLKCCEKDNTANVLSDIFGKELHKKGKFDFIKKCCFTNDELNRKLSGEDIITKQDIVLLAFCYYFKDGAWADLVEELEEKQLLDNKINILANVYEDFSLFCEEFLRNAGFSSLYLPNPFERTLVLCLMTMDPLETFKQIVSA